MSAARTGRRLLYVAPAGGGVGAAARSALPHLRDCGWQASEVWLHRGSAAAAWVALRAWWSVRERRRCCELVHVELGKLDLPCFWFALLSTVSGTRTTITVHDPPMLALHPAAGLLPQGSRLSKIFTYRLLAPLLDGPLERFVLRRIEAAGVLSREATRSWEGSRAAPRSLAVLAHGADARGEQGPPSEGEAVLMAGFLGPNKGLDTLIAAWTKVGPASTLPLWVVGETTDPTHEEWVAGLRRRSEGLSNAPVWHGAVEDARWRELFRRAAIVVLPYRYSSPASGPLIRALVEGRAIVMSDVPAARAVLLHERNALIVPREDVDALAAALGRLLEDPPLRDRLGACAEQTARARYSWAVHARGLSEMLLAATSRGV